MATSFAVIEAPDNEPSEIREKLEALVIGQKEAIDAISDVWQTHLAGIDAPGKPIASFLFLGPTGTGKTHIVEAMGEILLGSRNAMIKIDCAEFQRSHEVAKLTGSPPGYLGHRETGAILCQEALNQFHTDKQKLSLVLFDEIEKASPALWDFMLGILDKGILTLGDNRRVDFSNTMIFMTSNIGASRIGDMLRPGMGFQHGVGQVSSVQLSRAAEEAMKRRFTPEFINRIDKIVTFQPLGTPELQKVLDLEINALQERLVAKYIIIRFTRAAKEQILKEGTSPVYGARHLKRALQRLVVQPMAKLMTTGRINNCDILVVDFEEKVLFRKSAEKLLLPPPVPNPPVPITVSQMRRKGLKIT